MSSDIAIRAVGLGKTYRIYDHPFDRVRQLLALGGKRHYREFHALKDVSFEIKKGETVGIIGRNGSGKSTLLQLICGILKPTTGTVEVNGRVSALLELGAGFHPEFTGRENVYMQGAIMGLSREEMDARFDDIAAFADIGDFIEQPVKTYSSGMFVRLAFAVAVSVEPDILVVDEALSVGDAAFQHRSRKTIQNLNEAGASIILVTHDRRLVTGLCTRAILFETGAVLADSYPDQVLDLYLARLAARGDEKILRSYSAGGRLQTLSGSREATIERISFLDRDGIETQTVLSGHPVELEFFVRVHAKITRLVLGFSIRDRFGQHIYGTNTNNYGQALFDVDPGDKYRFRFAFDMAIGEGSYSISTVLVSFEDRFSDNFECRDLAYLFAVENTHVPTSTGIVWMDPVLQIVQI